MFVSATVCFTNLDQGSEMIILKSILTTFIASIVFRSCWGSRKNYSSLKSSHQKQIELASIGETHCINEIRMTNVGSITVHFTDLDKLAKVKPDYCSLVGKK